MRTPRVKKSQTRRARIVAEQDVDSLFDDNRIRSMALAYKLPATTDLSVFGAAVRDAARIFAREVRSPNRNELHDEISNLHKLADRKRFEPLAAALERLTPEARELLSTHPADKLPSPDALRRVDQRDAACDAIAALCRYGGTILPGRRRPGGKRSRPVFEPLLYAPEPSKHFGKRNAERNFGMWLQIAYLEAVSEEPPRTARHVDAHPTTVGAIARARRKARSCHTTLGPFVSFVKECLKLVGAGDVDVVELINSLRNRRRTTEPPRQKDMGCLS